MNAKVYDLKTRTREFALDVRTFLRGIPQTAANREDGLRALRASGSVGANYLESDNALGVKDRLMRLRICLKEAKECDYWLSLRDLPTSGRMEQQRMSLRAECSELTRIFAVLIRKAPP